MTRRASTLVHRLVIGGGLVLLVLFAFKGAVLGQKANSRIDRQEHMGTPSMQLTKAAQVVSSWAGQPATVIHVEQEQDHWRVQAIIGPTCYEMAVADDKVSSHPGVIPCPTVTVASSGDSQLSNDDERRAVVTSFLMAWLGGDTTADRYLADNRPAFSPPGELAEDVKLNGFYGNDVSSTPGTRSLVTATGVVTFPERFASPKRVESLAWTFLLQHGDTRWSIVQMAGGEVPDGDKGALVIGRTPDTTPPR